MEPLSFTLCNTAQTPRIPFPCAGHLFACLPISSEKIPLGASASRGIFSTLSLLSLGAQEKKCQGSQAGVGANHRTHIPNGNRDHVQPLLDHRRQSPRLVQTVSMADVNALILGVYGTLLHVFEQCLNGLFPSLGRLHGHQMPLVIHVEHWFDIEQVPHNRLAGGKAPRPGGVGSNLPL